LHDVATLKLQEHLLGMDPGRSESADVLPLAVLAESSRERLRRARAQLATRASVRGDDLAHFQQRLVEHVEQLQAQVAAELERDRTAAHDQRQTAFETLALEEASRRADFFAEQQAARTALETELTALRTAFAAEHEAARLALEAERAETRTALDAELQQWNELREEVEAGLAQREIELGQRAGQVEEQLAAVATQRATLHELLASAATEQSRLESLAADFGRSPTTSAGSEDTAAALRLRGEILQLKTDSELLRAELTERTGEIERLQQQFNSATEQLGDLANQLEAATGTAAKLAAERDELLSLVDQLRIELVTQVEAAQQPTEVSEPLAIEHPTPDSAELDELRARFEMAVEDVRTLKAEKRELEARLSSASPVAKPSGGGSDWEARKRQLLVSLEEELGFNEERAEERATIEGTIRITDEVLAEKQREIDALRAERSVETTQAAAAVNTELFDNDEVIAAERQRIATLRADWETNLRAAELELSIERAKIAREQSELAQWRMELETLRDAVGGATSSSTAQKQRRWRDKLGLGGHE
jgi:hypothetical protein